MHQDTDRTDEKKSWRPTRFDRFSKENEPRRPAAIIAPSGTNEEAVSQPAMRDQHIQPPALKKTSP